MFVNIFILLFTLLILYQVFYPDTIIEGLSDEQQMKDHDAIISIQAQLNTKYKQLIEDEDGKPVHLLSKIAALESTQDSIQQDSMNEKTDGIANVTADS